MRSEVVFGFSFYGDVILAASKSIRRIHVGTKVLGLSNDDLNCLNSYAFLFVELQV